MFYFNEIILSLFLIAGLTFCSILYAVEMNKRRFKELKASLKLAGVTCAHTLNNDFLKVTLPFNEIDYVLLDPSCSGSGIRTRNESIEIINERRLARLASLQIRMVSHVLANFPKVKRVAYSTCSIHAQENEQVVETILDRFGNTFQVEINCLFALNFIIISSLAG